MAKQPLSKEAYDAKWMARVLGNCERSETGCLLWKGNLTRKRYGETNYRGRNVRVHRQLYKIHHKVDLPPDVLVCHRCDVRHCAEISHLWLGSNDENQFDAWQKGRKRAQSATHCKAGHEFTKENTARYAPLYRRTCLRCSLIRNRLKAGWTREEAESTPVVPVGVPTKRRYIGARRNVSALG